MIVIKIGGSVLENLEAIISDLPAGEIVIVHGGSKAVTKKAESLGIAQKFVMAPNGLRSRLTDIETMKVFKQTMLEINCKICGLLEGRGMSAAGICGLENSAVKASRKERLVSVENGRKMLVEGNYSGKVEEIDSAKLRGIVSEGKIPILSPVALGSFGEELNIDADSLASLACRALNAERLVMLTDVDGILDFEGKTIASAKASELSGIKAGFGMNRKILEASRSGAKEIIITNGLLERPFSEMRGTVVENDII